MMYQLLVPIASFTMANMEIKIEHGSQNYQGYLL